jgi:hypothetical protein
LSKNFFVHFRKHISEPILSWLPETDLLPDHSMATAAENGRQNGDPGLRVGVENVTNRKRSQISRSGAASGSTGPKRCLFVAKAPYFRNNRRRSFHFERAMNPALLASSPTVPRHANQVRVCL